MPQLKDGTKYIKDFCGNKVEQNIKRCEELCELLPKATIINGDAADHELLVEEGFLS